MLYEGSTLNVQQAVLLILAFSVRHSLSHLAIGDLLQLLRAMLPMNNSADFLKSYYRFEQCLPSVDNSSKFVFYCGNEYCCALVTSDDQNFDNNNDVSPEDRIRLCSSCATTYSISQLKKRGCFFVMLSIASQVSSILDVHGHRLHAGHGNGASATSVTDVQDSVVYKEIAALRDDRTNISFTWNVDGVPIFKSSTNEVWPIRLLINELPPIISRQNVILGGLWFGKGKPNMTSFMQAFVQHIIEVNEEGVQWTNSQTSENTRSLVLPIYCSCDAIARCAVQCIHQFNGAFGCSWCLQPGQRVQKGRGHVNVYPLVDEEPRTHEGLLHCARMVVQNDTSTHVMGVKSASPLFLLHNLGLDMVRGFPVDYMHSVLLGVVRQFIALWSDSKHHESDWYLSPRKVAIIDKALLSIKPTSDIKRFPRNLKLASKWKASELKNFLLFYSVYVLQDVLPNIYLKHWMLLVEAVYKLLQEDIPLHDLSVCERKLKKFVIDTVRLYGAENMTYNVHQLSHLTACVKNCGPLWRTSAFAFENNNQKLLKLFSGTTFVPEQIAVNFMRLTLMQKLSTTVLAESDLVGKKAIVQNCVDKWLKGYPLTKSAMYVNENTIAVGSSSVRKLSLQEKTLLQARAPYVSEECHFYNRALIRGKPYCTALYGQKLRTHSYSVQLKNGCFAQIQYFVVDPVRTVMYIFCNLYSKNNLLAASFSVNHLHNVSLTDTFVAVQPSDIISKVVFLGKANVGHNDKYFIVQQPNTFECD